MVRLETDLVAFSLVIREVIVLQVSVCVLCVCWRHALELVPQRARRVV